MSTAEAKATEGSEPSRGLEPSRGPEPSSRCLEPNPDLGPNPGPQDSGSGGDSYPGLPGGDEDAGAPGTDPHSGSPGGDEGAGSPGTDAHSGSPGGDSYPGSPGSDVGDPGGVGDPGDASAPPGRRRRLLIITCAFVLVLALLLTGGGLLYQARQLSDAPAASNRALTDATATTQVIGDVSNTLGKVFSYVPQDTRATEDAARELLGGRAAGQYAALFGELRQRVAEQKLSLTTHVVRAGVIRLTRDQAELLVFLDQRAQRDTKPATSAAAQLAVTAQLTDGHWQITDLRAR
ncbi:hypothetical protein ACGFW5_05695 [Streptomyces sp. NPDC048416]|uniref:hypothetical protein n=1 Tax=Streptomyces sp. NPDC048416 TaxID=3365546 RepID=UPI003712FD1B